MTLFNMHSEQSGTSYARIAYCMSMGRRRVHP